MTSPGRVMQTLKFGFIVSGLLLILVMVKIPVKSATVANPVIEIALTVIALIELTIGLFAKPLVLQIVSNSRQIAKPSPLQRWMTANIFSLSCIDACMLVGLVLHFLRGRAMLVELLFGAALISLLFWSPGTPPNAENAV